MMVKSESLTFGGPFEAEVESGSVARGRVTLVGNGATYLWQPKSGKWLDVYATPEFKGIEYEITEITEIDDPSKSTTHYEIAEDFPGLEWLDAYAMPKVKDIEIEFTDVEDVGLKKLDATLVAMIEKLNDLINNETKV